MKKTFLGGLALIAMTAGVVAYHPEREDHLRMLQRTAKPAVRAYDGRHQSIDFYTVRDWKGNVLRIEEADWKGNDVTFKKHYPTDPDFQNYRRYIPKPSA